MERAVQSCPPTTSASRRMLGGRTCRAFLLVAVATMPASCFPFGGPEQRLDGPYFLRATDIPEQMALYRDAGNGNGIGRVGATVFAAGWDRRHIIVKRHPRVKLSPADRSRMDRTRTEYFILDRSKDDSPIRDSSASVTGPMSEAEFLAERRRVGVDPALDFTVVMKNLQ
jgi:hypothetical protein